MIGKGSLAPRVLEGGRAAEPADARVAAVLAVLAGECPNAVAERWSLEPALLHRWVRGFVEAGTAHVTNRPDPEAANTRDRFLAAFAHELRSPLTIAQGWVAVLDDEDVPPPLVSVTVERLDEALSGLADRVYDMELIGMASLGRVRVAPEVVTAATLSAGLPGLDGVDGTGGALEVEVDPKLFALVLRDVWRAACSALPEPRSVSLEAATVAEWVEFRIVRKADPIDPRVLQALFEPFDLNDNDTGVTIGLYLARALTVAHGGMIGVEQDEHSAVLWVRVPARAALDQA